LKGEEYDETLFNGLSEDDPLLVERRKLITVKQQLKEYLVKRVGEKKKQSAMEE